MRAMPQDCNLALDAGCGQGLLARKLRQHCAEVIAIDLDPVVLSQARSQGAADAGIAFVQGDVMSHRFAVEGFDVITAVAALHHLPLHPALVHFRELLRPGGVLAIIGLYRPCTVTDYLCAAAAFPVSRILRMFRRNADAGVVKEPEQTLREIRDASAVILPGSALRRRLLFRFSLVWRKPAAPRAGEQPAVTG